ncbi:GNAT family N-acetyltransferase [bacterium]|nr:GNAT family N-acetyltransferase [bacterium]
MDNVEIKWVTKAQLNESVRIICESFATLEQEFDITKENCPTHPSFMTRERLDEMIESGMELYGLFVDSRQVGTVSIETYKEKYYLGKLAVLPEYRHHGFGEMLVRFVIEKVRSRNIDRLGLGMIDKHTILKDWYKRFGFAEVSKRDFDHLPFTTCFMAMRLVEDENGHS